MKKIYLIFCFFILTCTSQYIFWAVEYDIIPLGSNQNRSLETNVLSVSDNGFVLGEISEDILGNKQLFVYHSDFGFKELRQIPGDAIGVINNNGVIAGTFPDKSFTNPWDTNNRAFVYDVKTDYFLDLGAFGWIPSKLEVLAISDSGLLLAFVGTKFGDEQYLLYDINTGKTDFEVPDMPIKMDKYGRIFGMSPYVGMSPYGGYYYISNLLDVPNSPILKSLPFIPTASNDNGVIAGTIWDRSEASVMLWYENGPVTSFNIISKPADALLFEIEEIWVCGINNSGQFAGTVTTFYQSKDEEEESRMEKIFFYDPAEGITEIGLEVDGYFSAKSLNNRGEIVGNYELQEEEKIVHGPFGDYIQTGECIEKAFIWDGENGLRDLDKLIPSESGWEALKTANSVNDDGIIVGEGVYNGKKCAFVLIPRK